MSVRVLSANIFCYDSPEGIIIMLNRQFVKMERPLSNRGGF